MVQRVDNGSLPQKKIPEDLKIGNCTSLTIGSGREPCCVLQVPGFDMISTCSLSCRDKQRDVVKWMAIDLLLLG